MYKVNSNVRKIYYKTTNYLRNIRIQINIFVQYKLCLKFENNIQIFHNLNL